MICWRRTIGLTFSPEDDIKTAGGVSHRNRLSLRISPEGGTTSCAALRADCFLMQVRWLTPPALSKVHWATYFDFNTIFFRLMGSQPSFSGLIQKVYSPAFSISIVPRELQRVGGTVVKGKENAPPHGPAGAASICRGCFHGKI